MTRMFTNRQKGKLNVLYAYEGIALGITTGTVNWQFLGLKLYRDRERKIEVESDFC